MSRQSRPSSTVTDAVIRQREFFAKALNGRLEEWGIDEKDRTTWLQEALLALGEDVRWQTVQAWLLAKSFPPPRRVRLAAKALRMNFLELMQPLTEEADDPPTWRSFLATPEGQTVTDEEKWTMRFFPWPNPPTISDYRTLMALLRANAERTT